MKRITSWILIAIFILTLSVPVYAQNEVEAETYRFIVNSTELGKKEMTLVKWNNQYLMSLDDILQMTRSAKEDDSDIIDIKHGTREIKMSRSLQQITENEAGTNEKNFTIKTINGVDYVPAFAMLTYLGANCSIQDNKIQVVMPAYTVWEAADIKFEDYILDMNEVWGSDSDIEIQLTCDIIMQMIYGVGIFDGANKVIESAMYETLDVDMFDYQACNKESLKFINRLNQVVNSNLDKYSVENIIENTTTVNTGVSLVSEFLGTVIAERGKNGTILKANEFSNAKDYIDGSKTLKEISKSLDAVTSFTEGVILGTDIMATAYIRSSYTDNTLKSILAYENATGEIDKNTAYYTISKRINNTIDSKSNVYAKTAFDKVANFSVDKMGEIGFSNIMEALTGGETLFMALNVGKFVTGLLPGNKDFINASDANLKAMFLTELQGSVMQTMGKKAEEIKKNKYKDIILLYDFKNLASYMVRTTMAANSKLLTVANSDGGNKSYVYKLKKANEELSVILFKLSSCQPQGILNLNDLLKDSKFDVELSPDDSVKTDINTIDKNELGLQPVSILENEDDTFYISNYNNQTNRIMKINNKTNEKNIIVNDSADGFVVTDQYIFYSTYSMPNYNEDSIIPYSGGYLKRSNLDGSNNISIGNIQCSNGFIIKGDKIYFSIPFTKDRDQIYSCNLDGSDKKLIRFLSAGERCRLAAVLGNKIYYYSLGTSNNFSYTNLNEPNDDYGIVVPNITGTGLSGNVQFFSNDGTGFVLYRFNSKNEIEKETFTISKSVKDIVGVLGEFIYYIEYPKTFNETVRLLSVNVKNQNTKVVVSPCDYGCFIQTDNEIFVVQDKTIKKIDPVSGEITNEVFSKGSKVFQLLQVEKEWIYCYEENDDDLDGTSPKTLVRFNRSSGEKQVLGKVDTYRG